MPTEPLRYKPERAEIDTLIHAAGQHPLGAEYLLRGHLGTAAITSGCPAFTIVAARDRFAGGSPARRDS